MREAKRDYYAVLDVPQEADAQTIRRAFRSLARLHHPDVAPTPEESRRFHELAEAYAVLSDPETRRRYDEGSLAASGPARGFVVGDEIQLEPFEARRGTTRAVRVAIVEPCAACGGRGGIGEGAGCASCGGTGRLRYATQVEGVRLLEVDACPDCGGRGGADPAPCAHCRGTGKTGRTASVTVRFPPGLEDGARIRVGDDFEAVVRVLPPPDGSPLVQAFAAAGAAGALVLLVSLLV